MTDQFVDANKMVPITPPPELVRQWMERTKYDEHTWFYESYIAEQAARWGADQELEACCEWLGDDDDRATLRAARRPKPPNTKQRGLTALKATNLAEDDPLLYQEILNAIESLPS